MSNQLDITGGARVRGLNGVITGTTGVLNSLPINSPNGIPQLDVNGKILVSQLPNSVMEFLGTWNAATNTPTLADGTGNAGDVYLCTVAGTVNFGSGPIVFNDGDYVVYSGSTWERSGGALGTVTSVAASITGNSVGITGSPITTAGTLAFAFAGTNLQYVNGAGNLTTFPTLITSIGLSMPTAFNVANSPLTANGTIAVTAAGFASQYIRGDGTLADFPSSGGGGSSVSYYLNGGTSQGVIGGTTYYEMSKTAVIGTGVDFSKSGDGFIVAFLTDANDPAQLNIPAGNWNYEIYASMSSNGGTPEMYAELYKYDGTTFTLISTSANEIIYDGTALNLYTFAMAVPATTLTLTDRLAVKLYATNSGGKTTTIHTQDGHLCQIITTFSTGITALNGLTAQVQYFQTGTSGTDFNISSTTATHTFNLPTASATNRGALSSTDWSTFSAKQNALTLTTTGTSGASTLVGATLNIPNYAPDLSGYVTLATTQTISGNKTFTGAFIVDSGTLLKIGASNYGTGYVGLSAVSGGIGVNFPAGVSSSLLFNTSNDYTYTFPNATGTVALTSNLTNMVTGTGTTNYLPKFTGASTIGNSLVQDNGSRILINTGTTNQNTTINASKVGMSRTSDGAEVVYFSKNTDLGTEGTANINGYDGIQFRTQGAESVKATLNASGNLGLGVTPSAWGSIFRAEQIGNNGGFLASRTDGINQIQLGVNGYFDGTNWIYTTSEYASRYYQASGAHYWSTAASGTAGAAITFTQAMTLNANGGLALGTITPTTSAGYTTFSTNGSTGGQIEFQTAGAGKAFIYSNLYDLRFYTSGGAFRFENTTGLEVGYSAAIGLYKLDVNGTGRFSNNLHIYNAVAGSNYGLWFDYQANAGSRTWRFLNDYSAWGDFALQQSTTQTGTSFANVLYFGATGAATFSSSVAVGGEITSTMGNNSRIFYSGSATTGYQYMSLRNTSGYLLVGIENSTGGAVNSGSSAYASVITTASATDLSLGTNQTQRLKLDGTTGAATFSSSVTVGTNTFLGINTTDGADNGYLALCGAGEDGAARGGHIYLSGNERSVDAGSVVIATGNTTSGTGATAATIFRNAGSERMRITSGGNVGIGTSSPFSNARLQVKTATNINVAFQTGTTETTGIKINAFNDAADANIPMELNGSVMVLKTGETERMRIFSDGNVGIGTGATNAGQKLQVNGITKTNALALGGTTVSSTSTLTSDYYFWEFTGGAGVTLTMYSSSSNSNTHFIKNSSGVAVTIAAHSGGVLMGLSSGSGSTSISLGAYKTIQLISRGGSAWYIMYQTT